VLEDPIQNTTRDRRAGIGGGTELGAFSAVERVFRGAEGIHQPVVNAAGENLGPQPAMDKPLLVPDCLQSPSRHLGHHSLEIRLA
jgi:hypothetical protein